MDAEKVIRKSVLLYKFIQGLSVFPPVLVLGFRRKEYLGKRHQYKYADNKGHESYRKEGEEGYVLN